MDIATYIFFGWMMLTNFIIMGGAVFGLRIRITKGRE